MPVNKPARALLVLASASPRRRELLARIGVIPDAVAPADIDETPHHAERPRDHAVRLSAEKAQSTEQGSRTRRWRKKNSWKCAVQ